MSEYKCCLCKCDLDGSSAYEYRGFVSCEEHFDEVIKKVDIRRAEVISRNEAATRPLAGLDIHPDSVIGKANRKLLHGAIEVASKETVAEQQYLRGGRPMSNIDKRALREAAERATPGNWWIDSHGQAMVSFTDNDVLEVFATDNKRAAVRHEDTGNLSRWRNYNDATFIATADPATVLALLDEMEAKDKQIVELQALARGVKQYSEFQICHYGATEDYAKGYIDCQNNYNKVLFAAAGKGE